MEENNEDGKDWSVEKWVGNSESEQPERVGLKRSIHLNVGQESRWSWRLILHGIEKPLDPQWTFGPTPRSQAEGTQRGIQQRLTHFGRGIHVGKARHGSQS